VKNKCELYITCGVDLPLAYICVVSLNYLHFETEMLNFNLGLFF